jgi:hypothetical protein
MTDVAFGAFPVQPVTVRFLAGVLAFVALIAAGCTTSDAEVTTTSAITGCADVIDGEVEWMDSDFRVTATVRSADTGWERYADAWEVRAPDGTVLGTRVLAHPHVDEQPFTRSLDGVAIPESLESVEIAARDSVVGFCGATVTRAVPTP